MYCKHCGKEIDVDSKFCKHCGGMENIEVDHKIPLVKGGADEFNNLQYLCKECNREKNGKYDHLEPIC